jgi:hypothetical protein
MKLLLDTHTFIWWDSEELCVELVAIGECACVGAKPDPILRINN